MRSPYILITPQPLTLWRSANDSLLDNQLSNSHVAYRRNRFLKHPYLFICVSYTAFSVSDLAKESMTGESGFKCRHPVLFRSTSSLISNDISHPDFKAAASVHSQGQVTHILYLFSWRGTYAHVKFPLPEQQMWGEVIIIIIIIIIFISFI